MSDPTDISGRRERDITNERDCRREQGGNNYAANYTRVWGNLLVNAALSTAQGRDLATSRRSGRSATTWPSAQAEPAPSPTSSSAATAWTSSTKRDTRRSARSPQYNAGDHTFKGGFEWSRRTKTSATLIYLDATHTRRSRRYLGAGVTAGDIAGATGSTWPRPAVRSRQHERLRRPHQHHRRAAEPRALLQRVRRQSRTARSPGRARRRAGVQQHRGQPERQINYDRHVPVARRSAGDLLEGRRASSCRTVSAVEPLHLRTSASGPSSGSTSRRPARTSSRSTGRSRRA